MLFKKIQLANNPFCKSLIWVVLTAFLFSTSCTTTRVLSSGTIEPQAETVQNELKNGDLIKITTKTDKSYKLRIAYITSEAILGHRQGIVGAGRKIRQFPFTEIAKIEKLVEKREAN